MKKYLVVGPEAWHLGVNHTSDNGAYQPEIYTCLVYNSTNLMKVVPGVKSLLPVHVLHRLHCLPLGKFSLFEIFVRMQLKYQIDGGLLSGS